MKVRHIRKRALGCTKRRNSFLWAWKGVERLSAATMVLMEMAKGFAAISDALGRIDWAQFKLDPAALQPFTPKAQQWAGTAYARRLKGPAMAYDNSDGRLRGRRLQAARLRIWSNDPHCAMCRKLVAYPRGFELDHITALHKDGSTNDDENLQVLCIEVDKQGNKTGCHIDKTAQDMGFQVRTKFDDSGRVVW